MKRTKGWNEELPARLPERQCNKLTSAFQGSVTQNDDFQMFVGHSINSWPAGGATIYVRTVSTIA